MSTLRPIWTPDDYEQTRRDAAQHQWDQYAAQAAIYAAGPVTDPEFVVTPGRSAFGTAAHEAILGRTIDELRSPIYRDPILGLLESPAPTSPPRGRYRAPERAGIRPRRAVQLTKMTLGVTAVLLVLVVGVLWAFA